MSEINGFYCSTCGQYHDEVPMDFASLTPDQVPVDVIEGKNPSIILTSDWCIVENKEFFVRGCLEIPVIDFQRPFVYSVWVSLSERNFNCFIKMLNVEGKENNAHLYPIILKLCSSKQMLIPVR
jgi:hypothetical protein